MAFPGGKNGNGTIQTLLNLIPPHETYVAAFAGADAIARVKRAAKRTVLIDLDPAALFALERGTRDLFGRRECWNTDGVAWLRHEFGLDTLLPRPPEPRDPQAPVTLAEKVFVFVDPPYPLATRSGKRLYQHEMTDEQHTRLLATVTALPCLCMVCSYPNDEYATELAEWHCVRHMVSTRGGMREECVWMNYPAPERLHDPRFVGGDKRQRERIRRRSRNWVRMLQELPAAERQHVVDAIVTEVGR